MTDAPIRRTRHIHVALAVGLILGLALLVSRVAGADTAVSIMDLAFRPDAVAVDQGNVVTWKNADTTGHTVTADDGSFDSGTLSSGDAFANLFESSGTFRYHCEIHAAMKGTITVKAVASTPIASGVTPPPGTRPPDLATPDLGVAETGSPGGGGANLGALVLVSIAAGAIVIGLVLRARRRKANP